jgi:CRP-like cAMP-binding protein
MAMDHHVHATFLSRIGWLSEQPAAFRQAILENADWREVAPDQNVSRAGDESGGIWGIVMGQVDMMSGLGAVDSPIVDIQLPGSWAGTGPLFGKARGADAIARTPSMLAFVSQPRLLRILAAHPDWWQAFGKLNTDLMFRYGLGLTDMLLRDPRRRCAAVLLRLCDCRLRDNPVGMPVTITCSQDEFGAMTNLSRQVAGGILRELERQGYLKAGYRSITLINAIPLRAIVNGS